MEIGAIGLNPTTTSNIQSTSEQISSGEQLNSAAQSPAAVQIVSQLTGQIRGESAAYRNVIDGVSAVQTAEGGLSNVRDGLQQLRELSIQANNGTLNQSDRDSLQNQADELLNGIRDSIENTRFNNRSLLNDDSQLELQTGANSDDQQSVNSFNLSDAFDNAGLFDIDLASGELSDTLDSIDQALDITDGASSEFGSVLSRLEINAQNLQTSSVNQSASRSQINDTDIAAASTELAKEKLSQDVEIALLSQANANRGQVLQLLNGVP
ncbi:MAG: flagellin [Pseudomonadales bacterium]